MRGAAAARSSVSSRGGQGSAGLLPFCGWRVVRITTSLALSPLSWPLPAVASAPPLAIDAAVELTRALRSYEAPAVPALCIDKADLAEGAASSKKRAPKPAEPPRHGLS
jgi:hypothetical protein